MTTVARPSDASRNALAKRAQNQPAQNGGEPSLRQRIMAMKDSGEFAAALPMDIITPDRFTRVALTALSKNPDLGDCTWQSVLGALVTAAQLGLEVNTPLGQASLVKYGRDCTLQIEYRGYISLARRSKMIESVVARTVFEHDTFEIEYGLDDRLVHKPVISGDRGAVRGYYAVAKYVGGGYNFVWMTRADVDEHRKKFSKQPNGPAWSRSFDSMGQKTVLRQMFKFMPMSVELARAYSADDQVRTDTNLEALDTGNPDVIDAEPVDPPHDAATGEIVPGDPVEVEDPPEHIAGWDTEDPQ